MFPEQPDFFCLLSHCLNRLLGFSNSVAQLKLEMARYFSNIMPLAGVSQATWDRLGWLGSFSEAGTTGCRRHRAFAIRTKNVTPSLPFSPSQLSDPTAIWKYSVGILWFCRKSTRFWNPTDPVSSPGSVTGHVARPGLSLVSSAKRRNIPLQWC